MPLKQYCLLGACNEPRYYFLKGLDMGACDYELKFDGKLTPTEVKNKFVQIQISEEANDERDENETQNYTGDSRTFSGIEFHTKKHFTNEEKARDYCLNLSSGWGSNYSCKIK